MAISFYKNRGFEKISFSQWERDFSESFSDDIIFDIKLPIRKTKTSAGYDIFSPISFTINPNESIIIPLGIKLYMLDDEVALIFPRSSIGFKYGITLLNTTGVIDADYYNNVENEGHWWIGLMNNGNKAWVCDRGSGIAQAVLTKFLTVDGDDFGTGDIRMGGIGSTGR